ncbi:MAG: DUF99 family protein [Thermoprotei archaeon]|jgi:endonuclease V-like protein UPF0215 family
MIQDSQFSSNINYHAEHLLGIDDGAFPSFVKIKKKTFKTLLVGVLLTNMKLEWIGSELITVDGNEATDIIIKIVKKSPIKPDIIFLSGISFAGFNIADPFKINNNLNIPIIIVVDRKPSMSSIKDALMKHFPDWENRWKIIEKTQPLIEIKQTEKSKPIYSYSLGLNDYLTIEIIKNTGLGGKLPEPLRLANMIATTITKELLKI